MSYTKLKELIEKYSKERMTFGEFIKELERNKEI